MSFTSHNHPRRGKKGRYNFKDGMEVMRSDLFKLTLESRSLTKGKNVLVL